MNSGAIITDNKIYRYQLWRIWDESKPLALWIMLNPSTADENIDDPTIRRCIGFSKTFGYGGIYVGNLFAYRTPNPKNLQSEFNPTGLFNESHLDDMQRKCEIIICAWGNTHLYSFIASRALYSFDPEKMYCLGKNKNGSPKHPLYLRSNSKLQKYSLMV